MLRGLERSLQDEGWPERKLGAFQRASPPVAVRGIDEGFWAAKMQCPDQDGLLKPSPPGCFVWLLPVPYPQPSPAGTQARVVALTCRLGESGPRAE